jgi:hypothetical protein
LVGGDDRRALLHLDQPVPGIVLERERRTEILGAGERRGITCIVIGRVNRTPRRREPRQLIDFIMSPVLNDGRAAGKAVPQLGPVA